LLSVVVAASSVASGVLHLVLWSDGYRHTPIRELFVAQGVVAIVVGVAALVPRAFAPLAAVVVGTGSLAAFVLSRGPGVPTLHGRFSETGLHPDAARTVAILFVEVLVVVAGSAMLLGARRRAGTASG
jgi:hypothetical protein